MTQTPLSPTETPASPPSPLTEAEPKSLAELFQTDPLRLTNHDVEIMVVGLIHSRHLWEQEEAQAKVEGRSPRSAKAKSTGKVSVAQAKTLELEL